MNTSALFISSGLYSYAIRDISHSIADELMHLYGENARKLDDNDIVDFDIKVYYTSLLRRLLKPQINIMIDGQHPFNPIKPDKLLPSLEWGMNWCVAAFESRYLLIHASVVVKDDKAIVFPARSGSGKTTLSTFLSLKGYQIYSDEMAIIDTQSNKVLPVYRPSSLKNSSLDLLKMHCTDKHRLSSTTFATHKGAITHLQAHSETEYKTFTPAKIHAVVIPKLQTGMQTYRIFEVDKVQIYYEMMQNSFNYNTLAKKAFISLTKIVDDSLSLELNYYHLEKTLDALDEILCAC